MAYEWRGGGGASSDVREGGTTPPRADTAIMRRVDPGEDQRHPQSRLLLGEAGARPRPDYF